MIQALGACRTTSRRAECAQRLGGRATDAGGLQGDRSRALAQALTRLPMETGRPLMLTC